MLPPKMVPARVVPKTVAPRAPSPGNVAPKTPPKMMPMAAPPPPKRNTEAGRLLDELMTKTPREGEVPKERTPGGRGSRPQRPCQIRRETGRSFERLSERLTDLAKSEAALQCKVFELQADMQAASQEAQGKLDAMQADLQMAQTEANSLRGQVSDLTRWNAEWQRQYQTRLTNLPAEGEWKAYYEAAQKANGELQQKLESLQTAHTAETKLVLQEMKDAASSRHASLCRDHQREMREKDKLVTSLREEILQKDQIIEDLKKADPVNLGLVLSGLFRCLWLSGERA